MSYSQIAPWLLIVILVFASLILAGMVIADAAREQLRREDPEQKRWEDER